MKGKFSIASIVLLALLCTTVSWVAWQPAVSAHCQIPCGIYGDATRFVMLREHITTIEKSMKLIDELSADPGKNANQLTRWVLNKESHADQFSEIVTQYFLQQRIKIDEEDQTKYQQKLVVCHKMLVHTMKAKQTTDQAHVAALRELVDEFEVLYMGKEKGHAHGSDHK